jgi:PAS domain-containing protein
MLSREPVARSNQPRYCLNVLVAHENVEQYTRVQAVLAASRRVEFKLDWASTTDAVLTALDRHQHDACLIDERLGGSGHAELYEEAHRRGCRAPMILVCTPAGNQAWPDGSRGPDAVLDRGQLEPNAVERAIRQAIEGKHPALDRAASEAQAQALRNAADGVADEKGLRESQRFLRGMLDALSSRIAVLDETGRIIAVNESWSRWVQSGAVGPRAMGVGANYLESCQSTEACVREGRRIAQGILDVMSYVRDEFHLAYAYPRAGKEDWFTVRVTRFRGDGPLRVVVAHDRVAGAVPAFKDAR